MSSNRDLITPIERNRRLLDSVFKFNPSSKLYNIVIKRGGDKKKYFCLHEILTILKNYIRMGFMTRRTHLQFFAVQSWKKLLEGNP